MQTPSDCLVLKIEEFKTRDGLLDTTIYVLYDKKEHQYVIRGIRSPIGKNIAEPFHFVCDSAEDLADFLSFAICELNLWTTALYNYNNLPATSNEITYYFLDENYDSKWEICGYDKEKFDRKKLLKSLRLLRNVFNFY
jgi:hypothetical protein